jgi:hypothetical protein
VRTGNGVGQVTTLEEARKAFPPIWVIYDHPRDYPDHFVVRVAWGLFHEPDAQLATNLVDARRIAIDSGASFCLGRAADDDPVIAECWI